MYPNATPSSNNRKTLGLTENGSVGLKVKILLLLVAAFCGEERVLGHHTTMIPPPQAYKVLSDAIASTCFLSLIQSCKESQIIVMRDGGEMGSTARQPPPWSGGGCLTLDSEGEERGGQGAPGVRAESPGKTLVRQVELGMKE
ncbi:hypothetical protein llap_3982 [Limosa lapponica baueri]|uniref:Uncharacterized protein n=1 Tax=Limosa lapponica baueri TaxID=1758121 RepID=A0A2I0UI67_LIMLA|nr:hypothetical protein llap_3982 [Limosa lapponica baueri]